MKCPGCNVDVQLGEKFCKSCGAELPQDPETPVKNTDPTAADKMRNAKVQTEDHVEEKDLWEGRYSVLEAGGWWILSAILLLAVVVFYLVEIVDGLKGSNTFLIIGISVAALVFLFGTVRHVHGWLTNKFKITTQRVFYIQGFLSRTTDELEIIRVDDVQYKQNLYERLFNVGTVVVIAPTDRTHGDHKRQENKAAVEGKLELKGVKNPEEVKELIRKYCRLRRDKGALFVEQV
jgi:membrane protein YdbS with pleckstrin-like domain